MAIQFQIGGVDYTSYVDFNSFKVDNNISVTSDTSTFNVVINNQQIARPKGGVELVISNGSTREFAGVLMNPIENELASGAMNYQCKSRDYGFWADKKLIVEDFIPDYAGNMIKTVVSTFCPAGFTTNNVQTGPLAPYQKIDYMAPTKFIKKLADLFSYGWYIDYYKDVHFFAFETFASPLPNNSLNIDDSANSLYFSNMTLSEDVSQIRNRVYLKGWKAGATYQISDKFVADGQQTSFPLKYEPIHDLTKMTVTVGGTTYPPKKDIVEGLPTATTQDGFVYINFDSPQARFNVAPANGTVIIVTYNPRIRTVLSVSDAQAQKIMQSRDQMDGIYEHVIDDHGLSWDDPSIAQARGQLSINKYGRPHYSGTFNSFLQGWRAGQFFYFYSKKRMDGDMNGLKMFITKVSKSLVNHPINGIPTFKYTISFADSPYVY